VRRRLRFLGLVAVGCVAASCSSAPSGPTSGAGESELNVHVAASLSAVFEKLGDEFASQFPDVTIRFNFAGSSTLVTQIREGAPADVVVMADSANMDKLVSNGDVNAGDVDELARNELAILVEKGNPSAITSLDDLTRPDVRVVLCDEAQPCGRYASQMLEAERIDLTPASRELSAAAVLSRVANGEADAGIAYVTDGMLPNDNVEAVRIPSQVNVTTNYPIAKMAKPNSGNANAVEAFIALVRGPSGDEALTNAGFTLP
jgi:molybdate transport system substrate-binding protein